MMRFRFHRSTNTPVNGPISAWGNIEKMAAKASTSADFVSKLNQSIEAKLTTELLKCEKNCPVHMIVKTFFQ
ncbi:hypothetical protein SDC9_147334 [bioreactor metagenome]|uniref:Uncharacterized protein n=1 Tax=bioreactor metagenome TaxID=1076179 RepID=A0A645EFL4_9ZZZZ